jgi:hypothetical protein
MKDEGFFPNGPRVLLRQYRCTCRAPSFRFSTFLSMACEMVVQGKTSLFVPVAYPRCTIVARNPPRDSLSRHDVARKAVGHRGSEMTNAFQSWVGQAVVLQVALGDIKVPLRGKLLKDGDETVRMRIGEGWDVDIYKVMILAVEHDAMALLPA